MKSLQSRLHLGLLGSLFVLISILWLITHNSINHVTKQMLQTRLEHDGEALLASLKLLPNGKLSFNDMRVGPVYNRVFSGHYYVIKTKQQEFRSHSLWDQTLPLPNIKEDHIIQSIVGPDEQKLLQWTTKFKRFNQTILISVAEDTSAISTALRTFNYNFAFATIGILLLLLLIQSLIIKFSLRPLGAVKQELQSLYTGEVDSLSKDLPSEIHPLIDEVNHLLQLLRKQLKRSRNATGNLAHSLKHPLNLLMQLSESEDTTLTKGIKDELRTNTQQINQLMERELKRAKLVGSGMPGQLFNPEQNIPNLIDVLERVYHDKRIQINTEIKGDIQYPADQNDMLELLGNLLDNACKWSNKVVDCKLSIESDFIIKVEDDGPGCNQEQLADLTKRGFRVDETTRGTGLGLAIVKDIVDLYNGDIKFDRSSLGGLCVVISLPFGS